MFRRLAPLAVIAASPAAADLGEIAFTDTETGQIDPVAFDGDRRLRVFFETDLRNGDFARGSYDTDEAGLGRVPLHIGGGIGWAMRRDAAGETLIGVTLRTSNGFHAVRARDEARAPRGFYETNNQLTLSARLASGLTAATSYTIKHAPDASSATTHETNLALAYAGDRGLGVLAPYAVVTVRPKGDRGLYSEVGIGPSIPLGAGERAPELQLPVRVGIGWDGFYGPGSGTTGHVTAGAALAVPVAAKWRMTVTVEAIVRDRGLRRIDAPAAPHTVVPLATIAVRRTF